MQLDEMTNLLTVLDKYLIEYGMKFYEVGGKKVFEIRDESGWVEPNYIVYIWCTKNEKYYRHAIEFSENNPLDVVRFCWSIWEFYQSLLALDLPWYKRILRKIAVAFDADGGTLGREIHNRRFVRLPR